ncbi:G-protein coupled receptor 83-like isoform X2 [Acropora muricata]|uniref:G-protein coupled receptor 83-like isoform X2 n=1 Tax=Acropora muricata TaxID=159855 RepID=UPI0034E45F2B
MSTLLHVITSSVSSISIILCIIGNSLVCAVIKKNRDMRSPIHFLLANVAVADITFSTFHISELSFRNISNKPEGMSGPGFCFLRISPIQWIGATCSTLSLVLIAFERYFVVRNPHGNQKLSREKLKVIVPCFWIFSTILVIPLFLILKYNPDTNTCSPLKLWTYQLTIVSWSIVFLSSSVLLAGLYSRVVYTLWFEQSEENALPPQQQIVLQVRKRVTLMVLIVTAIFAICWCADSILHLLERFYFHENLPLGRAIIHSSLTCNAAVNPFAYALINKSFRVKMKKILSLSSCRSATAMAFPLQQNKSNRMNMASAKHPTVVSSSSQTSL